MFTNEHFELLAKFGGTRKEKNNQAHEDAYETLKEAYEYTGQLAALVCKSLFPNEGIPKIKKSPTSQAQYFKTYTWAKIYPNKNSPKQLAYTVGIAANKRNGTVQEVFVVKLDTVQVADRDKKKLKYNELKSQKNFIRTFTKEEILATQTLEGLAKLVVDAIKSFDISYDMLAKSLDLGELTDEQILERFCIKEKFRTFLLNRSKGEKLLFCRLARIVNSYGLDWWHINAGYQLRFGRKNKKIVNGKNIDAESNFCTIRGVKVRNISLHHKIGELEPFDKIELTKDLIDKIENSFKTGLENFLSERGYEVDRLGYWPDELEIENDRQSKNDDDLGNDEDFEFVDEETFENIDWPRLNQILYGPPGTGKTYSTIDESLRILDNSYLNQNMVDRAALKQRFEQLLVEGKIRFTTFHQSFGYEDFVEGLRAKNDDTKPSGVHYFIEQGIFRSICEAASKEKSPYVLIIDEINRGNISKIFGELITLIEPSKRSGAKEAIEVILPYSKDKFSIPSNVHIIGTMNTADRSLALLDTALRRRFDFIPLYPDTSDETDAPLAGLIVSNIGEQVQIDVRLMLETINKRIEVLYDKDHCIGHAYFTPLKEIQNEHERFFAFVSIFKNKIIPLLEEYFFEDWNKIRLVLGDNQKAGNVPKFIIENKEIPNDLAKLFGSGHGLDELSDKTFYKVNDEAFNNIEAYTGIYSSVKNA